ncbi:MAG: hypothetical protein AVDCRST_MAG96-3410 [uncultured Segetibacter sp.]|uniref:Uncharacterized protein n=1 Tax=uncultured Segetibacter sp. TaxID=481133 RepID=A0A6J4TRD5_9BACT|nr:MAG: hypothetical protein AVDCRST_MAG96-3410 [uncultured Segetibacter sp.]
MHFSYSKISFFEEYTFSSKKREEKLIPLLKSLTYFNNAENDEERVLPRE